MNKTIQSNSYRPFSKSLLETWVEQFDPNKNTLLEENFLVNNLRRCLKDFNNFATLFTTQARKLAEQDPVFMNLSTPKEKENFELWLDEKISKALDVYWAQLSQAATQYTSPAYKDQLHNIVKMQPEIEKLIENLNSLANAEADSRITIEDVLIFFDELTLIRLAPYTKMALIGIPYRVMDTESSNEGILAGIAHELGHFLYWRLDDFDCLDVKHEQIMEMVKTALQEKLNESQQRSIRYVNAWFEELFADFVGAHIAREKHMETSKSMVIRNNKKSLQAGHNDHEHVADILRPLVSMYVVNRVRKDSLDIWRQFLQNDLPLDPARVQVQLIGEHEGERKITRSAEELSPVLLDAIDVISQEMQNRLSGGLFRPHFSQVSTVDMLSKKAIRLATKLKDKNRHALDESDEHELSALDVFLEPQTLEAGEQSHPHTVSTPAHSYTFNIYHTHH